MTHNPVKGVKRPKVETYEGKTPAIGDYQARELLNAPNSGTLKGKRDRAMLYPAGPRSFASCPEPT